MCHVPLFTIEETKSKNDSESSKSTQKNKRNLLTIPPIMLDYILCPDMDNFSFWLDGFAGCSIFSTNITYASCTNHL